VTPLIASGSLGIGVVWGWWTALQSERRPYGVAALSISVAAAAQAVEAAWLNGVGSAGVLLGGWLLGFLLHRAFRTALRMRLPQRTTS